MPGRRSNGEGSFTTRSDGRVQASVMVGQRVNKAGKVVPERLFAYGATKQEARASLAEKVKRHRAGISSEARQPLAGYLTSWLDASVRPYKAPNTVLQYEWAIRVHIVPALGAVPLDKLKPAPIQMLWAAMSAKGKKPKTTNQVRTVLIAALEQAREWGLLVTNPAALTKPIPERRTPPAAWSAAEARAFLTAISGHRYEAAYYLALGMGLRRGEITGLHWQDVDLDAGILRITTTLKRLRYRKELSAPKTQGSARTLAIPDFCVSVLRAHWAAQFNRRAAAIHWQESGLVFTNQYGAPMAPEMLLFHLQRIERRENLPRLTLHQLRHTYGTLLTEHGIDILSVSRSMGHTDIATTSRYYVRTEDESRRRVAGAISDVLKGKP